MVALFRRAKGLEDSPFFKGTIPNGRSLPYWESLMAYRCPDWFRDAKFGIWAHWSPSVCRSMYSIFLGKRLTVMREVHHQGTH